MNAHRVIAPGEWLKGQRVSLRLITLDDCTPRYVDWLADPLVNRYLETRWLPQDLDSVRAFVGSMLDSPWSYLFAIVENDNRCHVGNIKVGPVNPHHLHADVSYFIGERSCWGRGYATEAIGLAARFAFERLRLHRLQAGLYRANEGSRRALEKVGFKMEGAFREQLVDASQGRQDHLWFGLLRSEWATSPDTGA